MGDTLYGLAAIAESLGLEYDEAKHAAKAGLIPTYKVGRTVCSTKTMISDWQAANEARARANYAAAEARAAEARIATEA